MIIDTNADLVNCEFRDPRYMDDTINEAQRAGISCCIESGMTLEGSEIALGLKHSYPGFIFPAVGIAGTEAHKEKWRSRKELEAYTQSPSVVAIGEIGLDYCGSRFFQHRRSQKQWLRFQLKIARRRKLPVIIHSNAHKKVFALLKHYRGRKNGGVVRCENLTPELALAYVELSGMPLDVPHIVRAIEDMLKADGNVFPTSGLIIKEVCKYYSVEEATLRGKQKQRGIAEARQMAIYLVRKMTNLSLPDIGKEFSRDHSTIVHAIRKIEKEVKEDNTTLLNTIRDIVANIDA